MQTNSEFIFKNVAFFEKNEKYYSRCYFTYAYLIIEIFNSSFAEILAKFFVTF